MTKKNGPIIGHNKKSYLNLLLDHLDITYVSYPPLPLPPTPYMSLTFIALAVPPNDTKHKREG